MGPLDSLGLTTVGLSLSVLAGTTAHFLCNWRKITSDPWVMQTVGVVSHRAVTTPSADSLPCDSSHKGSEAIDRGESSQTPTEGSYHPCHNGGQPESRILLYHFPGSQERVQTDDASREFEASQQVSAKGSLSSKHVF